MMRNLKEEYNYKTLQPKQRPVTQMKEQPYVQGMAKIQNMNTRSDRSLGQSSSELNKYDAYKTLESRNDSKQSKSVRVLEKPPISSQKLLKPIPVPMNNQKLKSIEITDEETNKKKKGIIFMM